MKLSELARKLQARCECADEEVRRYEIVLGKGEGLVSLAGPEVLTAADVGRVEDVLGPLASK